MRNEHRFWIAYSKKKRLNVATNFQFTEGDKTIDVKKANGESRRWPPSSSGRHSQAVTHEFLVSRTLLRPRWRTPASHESLRFHRPSLSSFFKFTKEIGCDEKRSLELLISAKVVRNLEKRNRFTRAYTII